MNCTSYTLAGLAAGCKDSVGGVKKIWLAPFEDVKPTVAETVISAISGVTSFKVYNVRRNTASMTSTLNVSDNAGNSFTTDVVIDLLKMETSKRIEVMAMIMGETAGVVKDANNHYWYLGYDYPLSASAGTGETGTAMEDANHYNVTLQDRSAELPFEITDTSIIASLEAIEVA